MTLPIVRVGIGFDAHSLKPGRKLIIGGMEIPYDRGLEGHSDADVLLHAITDSLLGAAGLGDMGKFFPSADERFRDVSSIRLLQESVKMVSRQGFEIGNVDSVVVAQEPKLASYLEGMRSNIGLALEIDPSRICVKAKSTDGLGFLGRKEGIAAYAVSTLIRQGPAS